MTRLVLTDGRHVDVEIPAHTLIAMRIEASRRGDEHITIAGQVFRLDEIDRVVPAYRVELEAQREQEQAA